METPETPELIRRDGAVIDVRASEMSKTPTFDAEGRRVFWALAYDTTQQDRHGTTISPTAFRGLPSDLPVLLFHKSDAFPVARVVEWSPSDRGPVAGFVFADTDEARTAETLVAGGFLRGVSIGFIPYQHETRDGVPTYTDVELVELSLTPTPSSRGALIDLKRSIDDLVGEDEPSAGEHADDDVDAADSDAAGCAECASRDADTEADEADAATVADVDGRTLRLSTLLNRLR